MSLLTAIILITIEIVKSQDYVTILTSAVTELPPGTCPKVSPPKYGSLIRECGNNYQDNCYFQCPDGWDITGSSFRVCGSNGKWDGTEASCLNKAITCPPLSPPNGGRINLPCLNYAGGSCSYTCYANNRTSNVLCTDQGKWDEKDTIAMTCPSAEGFGPVGPCGPLFPPVGGRFLSVRCSGMIGEVCTTVCDFGYRVQGTRNLICNPDGNWSSRIPICVPATNDVILQQYRCPDLNPPNNGYAEGICVGATTGQTCLFNCFKGFTRRGVPSLKCQGNSKWDSTVPLCEPMTCPSILPIPNGSFKGVCRPGIVNQKCSLTCKPGYSTAAKAEDTRVTKRDITCKEDGKWSDEYPRCDPIICRGIDKAKEIPNGDMTGDCNPGIGEHFCSFSCNPGFALVGSSTLVCKTTGLWSSSVPKCISISCPPQKKSSFITVIPAECSMNTMKVGSQCKYGCQGGCGKALGFPDVSKCQSDGSWSSPPPFCEPYNCPQPVIENGYTKGTCNPGLCGFDCNIICFPYHSLPIGISPVLKCGPGGKWSQNPLPKCAPFVTTKSLPSSTRRPSLPSTAPIKHCVPLRSGSNLYFVGGHKELDGHDHCVGPPGHTCHLACHQCYELKGHNFMTCKQDYKWSSHGHCHHLTCPPIRAPENGLIVSCAAKCDTLCEFKCNPGFEHRGQLKIHCKISRHENSHPDAVHFPKWDHPVPECLRPRPEPVKQCSPLRSGKNLYFLGGHKELDGHHHCVGPPGHTCHLACHECYELRGDNFITCQQGYKWSSHGHCYHMTCPPIMAPENGMIVSCAATCNTHCEFKCNPGFQHVGELRLKCGIHHHEPKEKWPWWDHPVPQCVRQRPPSCPPLPAPQGGMWINSRCPQDQSCASLQCPSESGSECRLTCSKGFTLAEGSQSPIQCKLTQHGGHEWHPDPRKLSCWRKGQ